MATTAIPPVATTHATVVTAPSSSRSLARTWDARADQYRRKVWWCEICERRPNHWLRDDETFEVHHVWNRGIRSPLGQELDDELMTLCHRCHDRVTARHQRNGRSNGALNRRTGAIERPYRYAETTWQATDAEHRRGYWRRAWRRCLPLAPIDGRPR